MNQHYAAVNADLGACRAYAAGPSGEFVYWAGCCQPNQWGLSLLRVLFPKWLSRKSGVVFEGDEV